MTDAETERTAQLIRGLRAPHRAIVVVEHDMAFVATIADVVSVLHEGELLSEGSMDRVRNDPRVIRVYLGR
jgi:urea transport system ATP-binding protein